MQFGLWFSIPLQIDTKLILSDRSEVPRRSIQIQFASTTHGCPYSFQPHVHKSSCRFPADFLPEAYVRSLLVVIHRIKIGAHGFKSDINRTLWNRIWIGVMFFKSVRVRFRCRYIPIFPVLTISVSLHPLQPLIHERSLHRQMFAFFLTLNEIEFNHTQFQFRMKVDEQQSVFGVRSMLLLSTSVRDYRTACFLRYNLRCRRFVCLIHRSMC